MAKFAALVPMTEIMAPMPEDPDRAPPVLVLHADRLRAARGVVVARQVTLTAAAGQVVAVEGGNGSGKSTLLAAAAGLLPTSRSSRRPASVGYAPERADLLPRIRVRTWLTGLARTAGLPRAEASAQADDLLTRIGLTAYGHRPLRALSRGNVQRALLAQALVGTPELLVLDEPSGGLDPDGVARLTAEIQRAAAESSVVLVARHPTAPLPLPAGPTWQVGQGAVQTGERDPEATAPGVMEVTTGDGVTRNVTEAELPGVLRTALDAGLAIRGVRAVGPVANTASPAPGSARPDMPRRAGVTRRVVSGAGHRARLLATSQWFVAPALLFLILLGIVYSSPAGPLLPAAALTAIVLTPLMAWVAAAAQLADGRLLGRAFAAHAGGRGPAHLAACLATAPFAVAATVLAVAAPALSQPLPRHHLWGLLADMAGLTLAAAVLGVGLGSLLVPPLVDRAGWRTVLGVLLFLAVLLIPASPMRPLLLMAAQVRTITVPAACAVLAGVGVVLIAVTTWVAGRLP